MRPIFKLFKIENNMKKSVLILGILIVLVIFTGCSSDDDNDAQPAAHSIIGVWSPNKQVAVCSNGREEVYIYDDCNRQNSIVFTAVDNPESGIDGTLTLSYNSEMDGECQLSLVQNGSWVLNGENLTYKINDRYYDNIIFEFTENLINIGSYVNSSFCAGTEFSYQYVEYRRVE